MGPSTSQREHDGEASSSGGASKPKEKDRPRSFDEKTRTACWRKAAVLAGRPVQEGVRAVRWNRASQNLGAPNRRASFFISHRGPNFLETALLAGRHPERWRQDVAGNVVCRRFWSCHGCLCYEYDHIIPFSKGGESTVDNCQILQTRVNRSKSDKAWVEQAEMKGFSCDVKFTDKELDVIEMAVYGDVIRPGKQCRCKTVAEMLGQVKPKNQMAACDLPYDDAS